MFVIFPADCWLRGLRHSCFSRRRNSSRNDGNWGDLSRCHSNDCPLTLRHVRNYRLYHY